MKTLAIVLEAGLPEFRLPKLNLAGWIRAFNERRRLAELSDTQLADIGVTREDAALEAARPFWDLNRRA